MAENTSTSHNQLRLIAGPSKIYITFKRSISRSTILCSRIVVNLGRWSYMGYNRATVNGGSYDR